MSICRRRKGNRHGRGQNYSMNSKSCIDCEMEQAKKMARLASKMLGVKQKLQEIVEKEGDDEEED